jgi:hypothetical protein
MNTEQHPFSGIEENPSIYLERSGKHSRAYAEKLLEAPEHPLSVEEAAEALEYEASICEFVVDEDLTLEKLIKSRKSEAPRFFGTAFLKNEVHIDGLEGQLRQHRTTEDVYTWLAQSALDKSITPAQFRELARQSREYYIAEVQQALLLDQDPDTSVFDSMSIAIEPEKILAYARADEAAREFLLQERALYSSADTGVNGAKRAFVDVYTKHINGMYSADIKILQILLEQSQLISDTETAEDAYAGLPSTLRNILATPASRQSLYKRIDYLQNGIGYREDGTATAVDYQVFAEPESNAGEKNSKPLFTLEQREKMQNLMMSKEEIREVYEAILKDAGLLSSESPDTWVPPKRGHRAADGLFQAVINPNKRTLSADGTDGVVLTPNGSRSLYEMLTVGGHELTHLNQNQADLALSRTLRIGAIKGRRVSMLRETGANLVQRELENDLFGQSKPVAYAYARALQVFEAGGTVFEATKAFYNEKLKSGITTDKIKLANEAADRVLRLGKTGSNSQPMSYAEENIMNAELAGAPLDVKARATKITTLDLDDQLRIHTFGLLPELAQNDIDWVPLLMKHMKPYIDKALSET